MRKYYLYWSIVVFGIIATAYGINVLVYKFNQGKGLYAPALIMLIVGALSIVGVLALYISFYFTNKKKKANEVTIEEPKIEETPIKEEKKETPAIKENKDKIYYSSKKDNSYQYSSTYVSPVYVRKVGYGPILRVEGNRILDMRDNTYYRIENNYVNQEGYGLRYEIRGNQIKDAFGSYLYELSGNNINKVFGGFYASVTGSYITLFDLSEKYEMDDTLSKKQLLVVIALLFGRY